MLGRTLQVIAGDRSIQVEALGSYVCTPHKVYPDIQLSGEDAARLLNRPLGMLENILLVPLN